MSYTVAVDFDGVLHSYTSPWSGAESCPDPPVPGAIEWLDEIVAKFEVVILTTRGDQEGGNEAVLAWLRENGYTGPDLRVTGRKVPALVYVDDRAWRFTGDNFPSADDIHRAVPWNKPPLRPPEPEVPEPTWTPVSAETPLAAGDTIRLRVFDPPWGWEVEPRAVVDGHEADRLTNRRRVTLRDPGNGRVYTIALDADFYGRSPEVRRP